MMAVKQAISSASPRGGAGAGRKRCADCAAAEGLPHPGARLALPAGGDRHRSKAGRDRRHRRGQGAAHAGRGGLRPVAPPAPRLEHAAAAFVARHPALTGLPVRFDVMLVTPGRWPRHLADAWREGSLEPDPAPDGCGIRLSTTSPNMLYVRLNHRYPTSDGARTRPVISRLEAKDLLRHSEHSRTKTSIWLKRPWRWRHLTIPTCRSTATATISRCWRVKWRS